MCVRTWRIVRVRGIISSQEEKKKDNVLSPGTDTGAKYRHSGHPKINALLREGRLLP